MKCIISSLAVLLVTATVPLEAAPLFSMGDEWSRSTITLSSGRRPFAETLALYSKASKANVFADVTGLATTTPIDSPSDLVNPGAQLSRGAALARISAQMKMFYDRSTSGTFVLWPRTDLDKVARLIVTEQQKFDAATPAGERGSVIKALREFYVREKGWNPKNDTIAEKNQRALGVEGAVRFQDLPADLRVPVLAEFVRQVRLAGQGYGPVAWTDDYWKNARVVLRVPAKGTRQANAGVMVVTHSQAGYGNSYFLGVPAQVKVAWQVPSPHRPRVVHALESRRSAVCADTGTAGEAQTKQTLPPRFSFDPTQEKAFQKTVVLAHQSVALANILADLTKQGGITLGLDPDVAPDAKMTALSQGMPLWEAMAAVARVYSGHWQKNANGYTLVSNHLDELHSLMARMGQYVYYQSSPRSRDEALMVGSDLAAQIVDACGEEPLKAMEDGMEAGVALSTLPAELQKEIVALIREQNVSELIVSQQRLEDAQAQDVELRFAPKPKETPQFFGVDFTGGGDLNDSGGNAILTAYTADGRFIARLFPEVSVNKANKLDEWQEKTRKEMEEFQKQHPTPGAPPQ